MTTERDAVAGAGSAAAGLPGRPQPPSPPPARLSAAGRLALVRRFVEHLAEARDLDEVLAAVDAATREALGASSVTMALTGRRRRGLVTLLATDPAAPTAEILSRAVPLEEALPAGTVAASGEPVLWSSAPERDRIASAVAEAAEAAEAGGDGEPAPAAWPDSEAGAALPMIVDGEVIGVLVVGWVQRHRFSRTDAALLRVLAQQCAVAVDRARLQEAERAERDTLELLNEAIRILVGPLDPAEILRSLVRLAVPTLAPWCAVYVGEHKRLRRVAIEVAGDPAFAAELQSRSSLPSDADIPLARSYRTGETLVVPVVTRDMVRQVYDESLAARIPRLEDPTWTGLVVPVKAAGRVLGVMSLVSEAWGGDPPEQVRYAAEGLAGRAGIAIANADSFERARLTAKLLTDALLPAELPAIAGHEVAARYIPSRGQVAGDWFDVAHLPSGRFLLGMGDVAGQGIPASALMAQLRNAARGLAVGDESPAAILHGLALLTAEDDPASLASALYAILDPAEGVLRWAAAGHVAPLRWDGEDAVPVDAAQRPPLGAPGDVPAPEHEMRLGPGEALVLVSDGVLERRGEDIGERFESLRSLVARHGSRPAAGLVELLVNVLCDEPEDDCCVLVLKRH